MVHIFEWIYTEGDQSQTAKTKSPQEEAHQETDKPSQRTGSIINPCLDLEKETQ